MVPEEKHDIAKVGRQFMIDGPFISASPYGDGHINDTYLALYNHKGAATKVIHQRINQNIFKDAVGLMDNVRRVTEHQRSALAGTGAKDLDRRALTLISARDGLHYHKDEDGNIWRTCKFIDGATTYDKLERIEHAYMAAKAFGEFQKQLVDLPGCRLHETIPDFHNTPKRFQALLKALEADVCGRAKTVALEIEFVKRHEEMTGKFVSLQAKGSIPERIAHNDTKINNVMLDDKTGEGVCVIDLDTVMPGLVLYDFGDMVRTATNSANEDEVDLSKVYSRIEVFEALAKGYIESAGSFLNDVEVGNLVLGGKMMAFESGIRFLTDFLAGDVYFKTHRDNHNLDRARNQFKLVESIGAQEAVMNRIVLAAGR